MVMINLGCQTKQVSSRTDRRINSVYYLVIVESQYCDEWKFREERLQTVVSGHRRNLSDDNHDKGTAA